MANPVNFILLGHQRCGSNVLLRAFMDHPEIRMLGEVLSEAEPIRTRCWTAVRADAWTLPRAHAYQPGEDGAQFLAERVFSDAPSLGRNAFGFKIFYNHAHFDGAAASAWDYLEAHRDIRIIHLFRRNLLEALISLRNAEKTDRWSQRVEAPTEGAAAPPPYSLDPEQMRCYFEEITRERQAAEQRFSGHKTLRVEYEEELCADFNATANRAFAFLDCHAHACTPFLRKQQQLAASEQVHNYGELRSYFRHTPYAGFFA